MPQQGRRACGSGWARWSWGAPVTVLRSSGTTVLLLVAAVGKLLLQQQQQQQQQQQASGVWGLLCLGCECCAAVPPCPWGRYIITSRRCHKAAIVVDPPIFVAPLCVQPARTGPRRTSRSTRSPSTQTPLRGKNSSRRRRKAAATQQAWA